MEHALSLIAALLLIVWLIVIAVRAVREDKENRS